MLATKYFSVGRGILQVQHSYNLGYTKKDVEFRVLV